MFKKKKLYAISTVRLLLIPLIVMVLLTLIPGIGGDIRYCMLISSACPVGSNLAVYAQLHDKDYTYINPLRSYNIIFETQNQWYINDHTISHYLFYTFKEYLLSKETPYTLTQEETIQTQNFINTNNIKNIPNSNLIICIIESFNSFVITEKFMPNVCNFINKSNNILYVNKIKSQIKNGMSGDGQMIIQTGLLPTTQGVACIRFPFNKYPSLSSLYTKSAGLFPGVLTTWNQYLMSPAYNIDTNFTSNDNDILLFSKTIELAKEYNNVMMLTASTHLPCTRYANKSDLELPDTLTTTMKNYIKSSNVLDKGMKILFDAIDTDEMLKNSTIIITGDHHLPVDKEIIGNAYNYSELIPLIIYSPKIKEKTIITDTCYQMDIYPTILHLIDCETYYWKGFGVNLIDSTARHNRPITQEEAYQLSDKIIRANYFKELQTE